MTQSDEASTKTTEWVGLGLGANLGDPGACLTQALSRIRALPETEIKAISPTYWTPPWGVNEPQPDYLNAVCLIRTGLSPEDLLMALQVIEKDLGRVRGRGYDRDRDRDRYAARTLDLDILFFGDQVIHTADLELPHPRLHERGFVLLPLSDIAPHLEIVGLDRVGHLLEALDEDALDGIRPAHIHLTP